MVKKILDLGPTNKVGQRVNGSEHSSNHTRIWSELSGSAARSSNGVEERQGERNPNDTEQQEIERISMMQISNAGSVGRNVAGASNSYPDLLLFFVLSFSFFPFGLLEIVSLKAFALSIMW